MSNAKPIPDGFRTVTPALVVRGCAEAIEFYKKAFGAEAVFVGGGPEGKIMHAEIRVGDSIIMLSDEFPEMDCIAPPTRGGATSSLYLYVEDCDALYNRAVAAGAQVRMPMMDAFWGDRCGAVVDPYGHMWSIATHKKDMTLEQIQEAAQSAFSGA